LPHDAYFALYPEKLTEWYDVYPIAPDTRLWCVTRPKPHALGERRVVA
jgi:hypothetical protein